MATKDYIVQSGDWLSKIAGNNNTTVDAIMAANPQISNPNLIYTGDVIKIPDAVGATGNTSGTSGTGGSSGNTNNANAGSTLPAGSGTAYKPSQQEINAQNYLNSVQQNAPGPYQSQWNDQLMATVDSILNRDPFSYDFNADPIYQQYKDQYTTLGEQAMLDTMGNAAALTGGYGNSYASTAGNQAYQGYLQQLNNVIPELTQQAYNRWLNDNEALRSDMAMLADLENMDYGKYMDLVNTHQNDRNFALDQYLGLSSQGYNQWADQRDFENDEKWRQQEWDYMLEQDALNGGYYSGPSESEGDPEPTNAAKVFLETLPKRSVFVKGVNNGQQYRTAGTVNSANGFTDYDAWVNEMAFEAYTRGELAYSDIAWIASQI